MNRFRTTALLALVAVGVVGLGSLPLLPGSSQRLYGTELPKAALDPAAAEKLDALVTDSRGAIDAMVALRDGRVVFEQDPIARPMNVASVRKSVLGMLFGIAAERGLIDLDATLEDLGIEESRTPLTPTERQATVRDLLASRSGVYLPGDAEGDLAASLMPERGSDPPGTTFVYANWGFNVLGAIFEAETGLTLGQAFDDWIATPTGMQDFSRRHIFFDGTSTESDYPAYRVILSARDLARFGAVIAAGGQSQGRQIIPASWIEQSAAPLSQGGPPMTEAPYDHYGLSWWLDTSTGDMVAAGTGGQFLLVGRRDGLVIVMLNDTGTTLGRYLWYRIAGRAADGHHLLQALAVLR